MRGFGLFALLLCIAVPPRAQTADTVLLNGKIVTADSRSSIHGAIAIDDGRISAVGTSADIRKLAGPATRVIDVRGRTVIPGLIDSPPARHSRGVEFQHRSQLDWSAVISFLRGEGASSNDLYITLQSFNF